MVKGPTGLRRRPSSLLIVIGLGLVSIGILGGEDPSALELSKEEKEAARIESARPESIPELVKRIMPSVINVRSTKLVKPPGRGFRGPYGPKSPFRDFFGDESFERFFGDMPPREFPQNTLGSGFIIDEQGYIVTNNHVIEKAEEIKIILSDEEEFDAKVVGRDPKTDIALIKIETTKPLQPVTMGDSEKLQVGESVIAIGNPFGLERTVTAGIVSAKGRVIGSGLYDDFIQTDASMYPGSMGGPLINMRGEVVGINAAIIAGGQGFGFATPINMVKEILPQLKEKGEVTRGWLGVAIQKVTPELAKQFGLEKPEGALVAQVMVNSPAEKAGIQREDIIIEFDRKKVTKMRELPRIVANTPVGKGVEVKLIRQGKEKTVDVVVGELKEEKVAKPEIATLNEIIQALAKAGQVDKASEIFSQALQTAKTIPDTRAKASALGGIARSFADAGQYEHALQTAKAIPGAKWILCNIAESLADAGQYEQALQIANTIPDTRAKASALLIIANSFADAGQYEHALQTAKTIADVEVKARALRNIARSFADAGQYGHALQITKTIPDAYLKASTLCNIADSLAKAGQTDKASEIFSQALQTANTIGNPFTKPMALCDIAESLADAGQHEQALQIANTIRDPREKQWALLNIAESFADVGQYEQALQTANTIRDASVKAKALGGIAKSLAKAGQMDKASEVLSQVLQTANTIPDVPDARAKPSALRNIAKSLADAGQYEQALQIAKTITDPRAKPLALCDIAESLAYAGQYEQALQIANTLTDASAKASALGGIAKSLAKAGQMDKASEVLFQALQTAKTIPDAWAKAWPLSNIANSFAYAGQYEQALKIAKTIPLAGLKATALRTIAESLANAGQYEQALETAKTIADVVVKAWALGNIAKSLAKAGL